MSLEALEENVIAQIRSTFTINSISQCVNELVLNSLDAKSTAIAIRVNLVTLQIQVIDNGNGISRTNLEQVSVRYMTSKCHSLSDLRKCLKFYGFRGEAIASIVNISKRVSITSREYNSNETFCKVIEGNSSKIELSKSRPSFGTTVTVEGFLSALPVRRRCIKRTELELVKRNLESLVIIYPKVSFTLRNDETGLLLLDSQKCDDVLASFKNIYKDIPDDFKLLKVSKHKISVQGLICKELYHTKQLQYIYVNKRPVSCINIQNYANSFVKFCQQIDAKKKHAIYVLHIKCPYADIDITLEPNKTSVLFKKLDIVKCCIAKLMKQAFGIKPLLEEPAKVKKPLSQFGLSFIEGVVRGVASREDGPNEIMIEENEHSQSEFMQELETIALKRKNENVEEPEFLPKKSKIDETDNFENQSLFTNFPEDEERGKDLIMDIFIKSLKVFSDENCTVSKRSHSESNETITQLEKERKSSPVSNKKNMISIGVQTTQKSTSENAKKQSIPLDTINLFDSNLNKTKKFNFFSPKHEHNVFEMTVLPEDVQNFTFSATEVAKKVNESSLETATLSPIPKTKRTKNTLLVQESPYFSKNNRQNLLLITKSISQKSELSFVAPTKKISAFRKKNLNYNFDNSLFELKKNKKNGILNQSRVSKFFTPRNCLNCDHCETITNSFSDDEYVMCENNDNLTTAKTQFSIITPRKAKKNPNETVSHYFTPHPLFERKLGLNNKNKASQDLFHYDEEPHQTSPESNLIITMNDEKQQKEIIERDLQRARENLKENFITPTLPQSNCDWIKEINNFGIEIYVNTKTGIRSFYSPKKEYNFEISKRYEFIPKGQSPILKEIAKVDSLSPNSKDIFQNQMIKAYEDELLIIKWQNYIHDKDPKKFFESIYMEKSKLIENAVPNIVKSGKTKQIARIFEGMIFSKELFENLEVIGQVDCKFIAAYEREKNLLLLFDQHAVHERVRLEELTKSSNSSVNIQKNISIFLPQRDLNLIKSQKGNLFKLGLEFDFFRNGIDISKVPLCVYNKSTKGGSIVNIIENLIKEIVGTLRENNGIFVKTPIVMQNIVNSEACRGAIKFGDRLSKFECDFHIKSLRNCNLPFQCAHGRPTLTPLITLDQEFQDWQPKSCLYKLKTYFNYN